MATLKREGSAVLNPSCSSLHMKFCVWIILEGSNMKENWISEMALVGLTVV